MISGPRPAQVVRRLRGGQGHRRRRTPRRGVRLPRPQRRRQVLDDADDRRGLAGQRRRAADPRHGPRRPTARRSAAGSASARRRTPSTTSSTSSTTSTSTAATSASPSARCASGPRSCWSSSQLTDKAKAKVEDLSGGMKRRLTIARVADQPARPAAARRADHRPRPAGPARAVGPAVPAQAAGRDARDHDALHGRGRAAVRPARGDGQGRDRGRGLAARADPASTPPARSPSCGSRSGDHDATAEKVADLGERVEVLPDRLLVYSDDGEQVLGQGPRARPPPDRHAGTPLHAGGRLPPPHRPDAGRLMATTVSTADRGSGRLSVGRASAARSTTG